MGIIIDKFNTFPNDFNAVICSIIEVLLCAFFVLGCLIVLPVLNPNRKKYAMNINLSLLLISSLIYYIIISRFNKGFAILYFIIVCVVLLIDYVKYIRRLIINDLYNDEVISTIFVIMLLVVAGIKSLSNTNHILFLWFEVVVAILFLIIDMYYFMYLLNKLLSRLYNTKLAVMLNDYFNNLSFALKRILGFIFSPILILKKLHLIISRFFDNKSILYYLQGFIAFSTIISFIIVYLLARHIFQYLQSDIDMYVIFITAIITPILLSKK